jgi:hypothetical protein
MKRRDDPFIRKVLSGYVPERREVDPGWESVLELERSLRLASPQQSAQDRRYRWLRVAITRSHAGGGRRVSRRALIIAFAVIVVLAGSALAVGSEMGWWPENTGGIEYPDGQVETFSGKPVADVGIVATGKWGDQDWYVAAYRSVANSMDKDGQACYGIGVGTPPPSSTLNSEGPGFYPSCASIRVLDPALAWSSQRLSNPIEYSYTDGYSYADGGRGLPPYILGPVVDEASRVFIEFANGETIETEAIAPPAATDLPMRFFVARLPSTDIVHVEARSADGTVVAQVSDYHSYDGPPLPLCLLSATCPGDYSEDAPTDSTSTDATPTAPARGYSSGSP